MGKWVCQNDETHIFDQPSKNGYCPICGSYEGFLIYVDTDKEEREKKEKKERERKEKQREEEQTPEIDPEVGLCVILMDASESMSEPAFKKLTDSNPDPVPLMRVVANSAASGIFDLERMKDNPNAYVAAFKFNDRVELIFVDTVAGLISKHNSSVTAFADYLYTELEKMKMGRTDINKALAHAYEFVDKYLKKQLPQYFKNSYTPMRQRILKSNLEAVSVANVRVLLYTDGMQFAADGDRKLKPNPFKAKHLENLDHDIVIGAYFGESTDPACTDLQGLVSRCPIHDEPQFFLFEKPSQIGKLKYLFRMASGASGFCPKCLKQTKP